MSGGGGFRTGSRRKTTAGTLAAKVTFEGFSKLDAAAKGFLGTLKNIRSEMGAINNAARTMSGGSGGMGGTGQGTATGAVGTGGLGGFSSGIASVLSRSGVVGPGGFNYAGVGSAAIATSGALSTGLNIINDRFSRNVQQSAPISSRDAFTASMYNALYKGMEGNRYQSVGQYGGTRENVLQAQQIALNFGSTVQGSQSFLAAAGSNVQASGGSMSIAQTAAQTALFASPMVSNRAQVMGIMTYKSNGVLANPLDVGRDYIKAYERQIGVTLNEIDYANLRSPGSAGRARMKQMFGLSDEAIDVAIQAGMQNMKFRGTGARRDINFGSGDDLKKIGLDQNVLGLQAARFGTITQRREARFGASQEGVMVDRLRQEGAMQEALSDLEEGFSGLIGPMHEFERVLKLATTALGVIGALSMMKGLSGGGGGLLGLLTGLGGGGGGGRGGGGGVAGQLSLPGMGAPGGAGMSLASKLGVGGMGVGLLAGGAMMANSSTSPMGAVGGIASATAGGAMIGSVIPGVGTAVGAAGGAVIGTAFAAKSYFSGVDKKNVGQGFDAGVGMSDKDLIASMQDYVKNKENYGAAGKGQGAGAKQRGRFNAFARRRGALLAAALDEGMSTGVFKNLTTSQGAELGDLVSFFSSDGVFNDDKLWSNKAKAETYVRQLRGTDLWRKYFSISDPFGYTPNTTPESQGLVMSAEQTYSSRSGTGDGAFSLMSGHDTYPNGGDPIDDRNAGYGDTWNKLDSRMKDRLTKLFRASGGRVWLGNGWRSQSQQEKMFLDRHVEDPNGSISWNGKKWRHVRLAAAAPPGRSMHEIGLAADLEGDLNWVQSNAAQFGLKTFANVNSEPWHVQPTELPNSRKEFETGGGTSDSGGAATGATPATAATAPQMLGGGSAASISGIGYSIAAAAGATTAGGGGGGFFSPATDSAAGGAAAGGGAAAPSGPWPADELARGAEVVKALKAAGFSGDELQEMAAISYWESKWNPNAFLEKGGDMSYGLFALNRKPWLDQGLTPPFTKEDAFNPARAAQIARMMFLNQPPYNGPKNHGPYTPWTTRDKPLDPGIRARAAANVGDAAFDAGVASGGSANVTIAVTINSTGNVRYDAQALGEAVRPVLSNVMAEISTKRGS